MLVAASTVFALAMLGVAGLASPRSRPHRLGRGRAFDTGIYVGDDDHVTVRNNSVSNYVIGVVVENTIYATVRDNLLTGNTAGGSSVAEPLRARRHSNRA
jgi:parallel beta-helix repeat protein